MIVVELQRYQSGLVFTPSDSFVFKSIVGAHTTATYWTTTFGATGDTSALLVSINSVILGSSTYLSKMDTYNQCRVTQQSFFYDFGTQTLYVHLPHIYYWDDEVVTYGVALGMTNGDVVLIGGVQYDPLVRQAPNVNFKQDFRGYERLSFLSGSITFSNVNGQFDDIIQAPIYGNEVQQYYLPNGKMDYDRSELVPIASYYVEDYDFTLTEFTLNVQDKRKSGNAKILTKSTVQGKPIPLVYGQVRTCKCLVNDEAATGNVTFRAGEVLTGWGTVQRWNSSTEAWDNYVGGYVSQDLSTGTFVVTAANGRNGGSATGTPLKFRLLEPTGITPAKPTDIIKDLNERVLGITYISSNYDQTEWAAATTALYTIGTVFESNIELFEAVRLLQNGSYPGFRYEIKSDGKRTARIDDWTAAATWDIPSVDIKDNRTLLVKTDTKDFAASVKLYYDKEYNDNGRMSVTNTTYESYALATYRQKPQTEIETYLLNSTDANTAAAFWAERLSTVRPIVSVKLHGQEYYTVRIYDIMNIELCTDDRRYFGKWKAQVLSVLPDFQTLSCAIEAVLIEQIEC
jgi:hypothetical protein